MNLLYLPALGLVLLFVLLPLVTSVKTSFYNWNGYSPVKKFVGMKNYLDLFRDENFKMAFLNTICMALEVRFYKMSLDWRWPCF